MDDPLPNEEPRPGEESDPDSRDVSGSDDERREGSDDEGEDLLEGAEADYRAMPELDRYSEEGVDDEVEEDITMEEAARVRLEAEAAMRRRDLQEGRVPGALAGRRRLPGALAEDLSEDEDDERPRRRQRREAEDGAEPEEHVELAVDLGQAKGPPREWLQQAPVQREILTQFKRFLKTFQDANGDYIYQARVKDMCIANRSSIEVDFNDLAAVLPQVAMNVADHPRLLLEIFHKGAKEVALERYEELITDSPSEIFVRMSSLPIVEKLRDIRRTHLDSLIRVHGVVTRRTGVFPQLEMVKYDCVKCGYLLGPFFQSSEAEIKPGTCPQCQSHGPYSVNVTETIYRNYQKITLQESPGSVPAGRLPRHKEVVLLHDLIDCARPGEEIDLVGIYTNSYDFSLNVRNGFPVFSTLIEANFVTKKEDAYSAFKLTDEDKAEIHQLGRDPRIGERIIKSIAPSIYGHHNIKTGIALALFGGQEKHPSGGYRLRGDINMLLLGDPGTAKSQFLKYVEKVAQRAVYTTGKGASAVGLTASVMKDPITREWTLEGGALVLADRGVCLIDEFDKMNDQDRVSIHEAMEQQSISISKAGIVTQLQARCSVIAAANPIGGRYDSSRTLAENVELTDPILSRFDILCVVKDTVDPVSDERLARFVVGSHARSHPGAQQRAEAAGQDPEATERDPDVLPQDMLRKYITYAKQNCRPKLQNADYAKIAQVYADLRRESAISHGMPIAVRHLESIIRMSESHAAMHLREYVNDDDVDTAIRVMLGSFISTQKWSVQKALGKKFARFMSFGREFVELVMDALQALVRERQRIEAITNTVSDTIEVPCRTLEERVREYNINDLSDFYRGPRFRNAGFSMDQDTQTIVLAR